MQFTAGTAPLGLEQGKFLQLEQSCIGNHGKAQPESALSCTARPGFFRQLPVTVLVAKWHTGWPWSQGIWQPLWFLVERKRKGERQWEGSQTGLTATPCENRWCHQAKRQKCLYKWPWGSWTHTRTHTEHCWKELPFLQPRHSTDFPHYHLGRCSLSSFGMWGVGGTDKPAISR